MVSPVFAFDQNVAPSFDCPVRDFPISPAIRFPGGVSLEPQLDPSKGVPGACGTTLDLVQTLQSALAPFQPFLNLLDTVAGLVQCFFLAVDALSNPFKIPDLLACIPALVEKVNRLLSIIPVLPQGIGGYTTLVADVTRFVAVQIDCIIQQLQAIQGQLEEVARLTRRLNEVDDPLLVARLREQIECANEIIAAQSDVALAALGPIARIFCTVKAILTLVPGGAEIARQLAIPDPSNAAAIDDAIESLELTRDALLALAQTVAGIGAPFGGAVTPASLVFQCPIDDLSDAEVEELSEEPTPAPAPLIERILDPGSRLPLPFDPNTPPLPNVVYQFDRVFEGAPPAEVLLEGRNFTEDTRVYWGTDLQVSELVRVSNVPFPFTPPGVPPPRQPEETRTYLRVQIDAGVRSRLGGAFIQCVTPPAGSLRPFGGLSETPEDPEPGATALGNQVPVEVVS